MGPSGRETGGDENETRLVRGSANKGGKPYGFPVRVWGSLREVTGVLWSRRMQGLQAWQVLARHPSTSATAAVPSWPTASGAPEQRAPAGKTRARRGDLGRCIEWAGRRAAASIERAASFASPGSSGRSCQRVHCSVRARSDRSRRAWRYGPCPCGTTDEWSRSLSYATVV